MSEQPDIAIEQEVGLFVGTCRTASLATVGPGGEPCAANVQFAHDDALRLYWVSSPDSLHSQNLTRDSRAAMTIYAHDDRAPNIHGLQLRGHAQPLLDEQQCNAAWELYVSKFTFIETLPQMRELVQRQQFYRFTPDWWRWIDNRKGFGFRVEKQL